MRSYSFLAKLQSVRGSLGLPTVVGWMARHLSLSVRRGAIAIAAALTYGGAAMPYPYRVWADPSPNRHQEVQGTHPGRRAVYGSFPESPNFRAFIPELIDLSKRMPPVGDQGKQGSCVGWAVRYAARSYCANASEYRDLKRHRTA